MPRSLRLGLLLLAVAAGCAASSAVAAAETPATGGSPAPAATKQFEFPGFERLNLGGAETSGANIIQYRGFRAGTMATVGPERGAAIGDGPVGFAGEEVGAFAEYRFDAFKFTANARRDASLAPLQSHSSAFTVGFGYGAKLASEVSLAVGPSATWANGHGSWDDPLGLAPATPGGRNGLASGIALHDVGASIAVNWQFLDRWQLTGLAGARQLFNDPGFTNEFEPGSTTQLFTGFAFGYRF